MLAGAGGGLVCADTLWNDDRRRLVPFGDGKRRGRASSVLVGVLEGHSLHRRDCCCALGTLHRRNLAVAAMGNENPPRQRDIPYNRRPSRIASFRPIYFAWDTALRFGDYRHLASVVSAERKTARPPLRESGRNRLVIIGESLTSRRMGVYGYPRNTTPELARLVAEGRLEVRPERRASSPYTARALMNTMLDAEHTQAWRDRADGYRTVLVSAQDRWERYCGGLQLLFEACDEKVYIRREGQPVYDEELIPAVKKAIEGPSPWVVYVHMMGSHFLPGDRVPLAFRAAESEGTAGFDDYDWSVRYTDSVVAQLVNLVTSADIYFTSDHGESVYSGRWRDPSDDALWVVPEIVSPATNVVSAMRAENG